MIVAIHNVSPANDNRTARFEEMKREVAAMTQTYNEMMKPGVIQGIVNEALRPLVAELALQEKEAKQRDGMRVNNVNRFKLPKVDGPGSRYPAPEGD